MKSFISFCSGLKNRRVALCGMGKSNTPLIEIFADNCEAVTLCDRLCDYRTSIVRDNISLKLGDNYLKDIDADIILRAPGIYYLRDEFEQYRKKGVAVTSEIELFFDYCPCMTIGITGSNGKTTTSTLISEILKAEGRRVWLGGNIGRPLLPAVNEIGENDIAVAELSSFQLISMRKSPDIAVITNISPNHLDVHRDMEEYVNAKKNIFTHQGAFSKTVLNADDAITAGFADEVRGSALLFSRRREIERGAFIDGNGDIFLNGDFLMNRSEIILPGDHNVENYLAAICAVSGLASADAIKETARSFSGVEHRIELVRELGGVKYYNDSIATSPSRTICGTLSLFDEKIILIAGGYDKKIPFDGLARVIPEKVKCLILLGSTADKIEELVSVQDNPPEIIRAENMEQAVLLAAERAVSDDIVALSPACASFDMYPDFEARGMHFKELVLGL